MKNTKYLYLTNFLLIILLVSTILIWVNHNDFHYYGATQVNGKLYNDIFFWYPPGSFFINKLISLIFPGQYNYLLMRLTSALFFFLSINLLAFFFLKKIENKIFFLLLTTLLCSYSALEIGNYTLSFLLLVISLIKFNFGKNYTDFFIAGLFFGLCLIVRPTFLYCGFYFLLLLFKKKNIKKNLIFSCLGGIIGLSPYIFYLIKDFNTIIFFNYKLHLIHNEVYRYAGIPKFFASLLNELYDDYLIILPLLLNYLYNFVKNFKKKIYDFILLGTLGISSLTVLVVYRQYLEPFFIIILLLIIKSINFNSANRFITITIIFLSLIKFLYLNKQYNLNNYSNNNMKSYSFILNTKKQIKSIVDKNFNKNCRVIFRSTSSIYLPSGYAQNKFNPVAKWWFDIKDYLIKNKTKYIDINDYLNFSKKDFNAILVGYYSIDEYEQMLVTFAENENWKLYNIKNFRLYLKKECII